MEQTQVSFFLEKLEHEILNGSNQFKKSKKRIAHLYMEKYSFLGVGSRDSSSSSDSES